MWLFDNIFLPYPFRNVVPSKNKIFHLFIPIWTNPKKNYVLAKLFLSKICFILFFLSKLEQVTGLGLNYTSAIISNSVSKSLLLYPHTYAILHVLIYIYEKRIMLSFGSLNGEDIWKEISWLLLPCTEPLIPPLYDQEYDFKSH